MNSKNTPCNPCTAVLFDIDGTLVDSNDAHAHAWVRAFVEAGLRVEFETVRCAIGMGGDKLMPSLGINAVAASSAKRDELEALLKIAGASSLLGDSTSADDAEESKPDPDIVHAALRKAGVACGGWNDASLRGAIAIYDGPWDLLARLEDSPLANLKSQIPNLKS